MKEKMAKLMSDYEPPLPFVFEGFSDCDDCRIVFSDQAAVHAAKWSVTDLCVLEEGDPLDIDLVGTPNPQFVQKIVCFRNSDGLPLAECHLFISALAPLFSSLEAFVGLENGGHVFH
jgi:hypothetical protein